MKRELKERARQKTIVWDVKCPVSAKENVKKTQQLPLWENIKEGVTSKVIKDK